MPTSKPRVFLTLGEKDEKALAKLGAVWKLERQAIIRRALREAADKLP